MDAPAIQYSNPMRSNRTGLREPTPFRKQRERAHLEDKCKADIAKIMQLSLIKSVQMPAAELQGNIAHDLAEIEPCLGKLGISELT